jgi:hypothetical protein
MINIKQGGVNEIKKTEQKIILQQNHHFQPGKQRTTGCKGWILLHRDVGGLLYLASGLFHQTRL